MICPSCQKAVEPGDVFLTFGGLADDDRTVMAPVHVSCFCELIASAVARRIGANDDDVDLLEKIAARIVSNFTDGG